MSLRYRGLSTSTLDPNSSWHNGARARAPKMVIRITNDKNQFGKVVKITSYVFCLFVTNGIEAYLFRFNVQHHQISEISICVVHKCRRRDWWGKEWILCVYKHFMLDIRTTGCITTFRFGSSAIYFPGQSYVYGVAHWYSFECQLYTLLRTVHWFKPVVWLKKNSLDIMLFTLISNAQNPTYRSIIVLIGRRFNRNCWNCSN